MLCCDHHSHPSSEVFSSYRTETWYSGNSLNPFTFCLYKLNFSKFSGKKRNHSLSVFFGWLISFIMISTTFTCVLNLGQNWLSYKGRINWPLCILPPFIYLLSNTTRQMNMQIFFKVLLWPSGVRTKMSHLLCLGIISRGHQSDKRWKTKYGLSLTRIRNRCERIKANQGLFKHSEFISYSSIAVIKHHHSREALQLGGWNSKQEAKRAAENGMNL